MTRGSRATMLLMFGANVAWFGGLIRLLVEAIAQVLAKVAPMGIDQRTIVAAVISVIAALVVEAILLWRFRGLFRQIQEDLRTYWGLSLKADSPLQINL